MKGYDTLFEAVGGLQIPVKILSTLSFSSSAVPNNVEIVPNDGSIEAFYGPMAQARLVVIPLRANQLRSSGQGTYLSAMFLGKCLIVSGVAGVRDLVVHGKTGIVVEPGNSGALRQAIVELWDSPVRARAIGQEANRIVASRNTHQQYMRTHLENMTELCRLNRGQRSRGTDVPDSV